MYRSAIAGDQVPDAFNAPDPTTRPMTVWDHKVKTLAGCMTIASRITSMNPDLTETPNVKLSNELIDNNQIDQIVEYATNSSVRIDLTKEQALQRVMNEQAGISQTLSEAKFSGQHISDMRVPSKWCS